ncbi:MAG: hypothetical protein ABFC62_07705 [Clostridiaceae bacterium]|nr:hypothetical protein [Eubacteriales bacterium]
MYTSPVPLMVIRADAHALIEVNGQYIGECDRMSYVAMPVSDSGDYYVCALPLEDAGSRYPVTRKLSFEAGAISAPHAADVKVCAWPGGVYELFLETGSFLARVRTPFPHTIDTLDYMAAKRRRTLTLYYENGIRLSVDEGGRTLAAYALGQGDGGSLAPFAAGGMQFFKVTAALEDKRTRLLLLDKNLDAALDITADAVRTEEETVEQIVYLNTLQRHERATRYKLAENAFEAYEEETGFFTHDYAYPKTRLHLVQSFCEAVREGFEEEARGYLTDGLNEEFSFAEIKDFLGNFAAARPPVSDGSGRYMGLIEQEGERLSSARLYEFSFEGEKIADILEA